MPSSCGNRLRLSRLIVLYGTIFLFLCFFASSVDAQPKARATKKKPGTVVDESSDEISEHLVAAGQILPVLQKLTITGDKSRAILKALREAVDRKEFFIVGFVGWAAVPLTHALYQGWDKVTPDEHVTVDTDTEEEEFVEITVPNKQFTDTSLYLFVDLVSQIAKIGTFVYGLDCLAVALDTMGLRAYQGLPKKIAKIMYTIWGSLRISEWKHYLLEKRFRKEIDGAGRARLYNRILNVFLSAVTSAVVLDMMHIDFGFALKSVLSFGGMGALIFSLSSKDFASELVSGLFLSASPAFFEGDEIQLGDGTAGIIQSIGLFYTDIRGYDEIVTRIPNSQLSRQRVKNLTRVQQSQVKQTLWFSYSDVDKMPAVIEAIKEEVAASCPKVITDGSRPFFSHWRDFQDDHLEVVVDFHFKIKAASPEYWENRQKVLEAIARAVNDLGVHFTLPSLICANR